MELTVHLSCQACNEVNSWSSQPRIGKFAEANLLLSAGILFADVSPGKVLRVLAYMGVSSYDRRTFFLHATYCLLSSLLKLHCTTVYCTTHYT